MRSNNRSGAAGLVNLVLLLCFIRLVTAVATAAGPPPPPPPASASGSTSLAQLVRSTAAAIVSDPAAVRSTRIGKPRYDRSGTRATVEITLDTGASVGVYAAVFQRTGVTWRLRGVKPIGIACTFAGGSVTVNPPDPPPSIPAPPEIPLP